MQNCILKIGWRRGSLESKIIIKILLFCCEVGWRSVFPFKGSLGILAFSKVGHYKGNCIGKGPNHTSIQKMRVILEESQMYV